MIPSFFLGLLALPRGLYLIATDARIRRWSLIPAVLAIVVFVLGIALGIPFLAGFLPRATIFMVSLLIPANTTLFTFCYWLVLIVAWPMSLFALLYLLFTGSRLIIAPIFPVLAECVLGSRVIHVRGWFSATRRLMGISLLKTAIFSLVGAVLFGLSFFPGLGPFATFGFLLIAAFDTVDSAFEALEMGFRERLNFFFGHWLVFIGFAVGIGIMFLIPGLDLLLFPAAVVGGSDVVRRLLENERDKNVRPRT